MASSNTLQYKRKVGLVVSAGTKGLDLSNMRIRFQVFAPDADAPPTAVIRVFNLKADTAKTVQKEFQTVTLQAGYEMGNYGIIFQGTIKQFRRGRESATDTFLDIMAADGDQGYNFAVLNKTLAGGSTVADRLDAIFQATNKQGLARGDIPSDFGTGGTLPRGKVLFGLAREPLTSIAASKNSSWSIKNGKINVIPLTGYLAGEAVVLNATTGMIGVPEATNNGIEVTCLINPLLTVGGRVQIDNKSINTLTVRDQGGFPRYSSMTFPADVSNDGFYRILVIDHRGDNWANEWASMLTCLAVDPSAAASNSVKAYG